MNLYSIKVKTNQIRQAQDDFNDIYGFKPKIFTRKIFFYFIIYNKKKYIHKESLRLVYTNCDTYSYEKDTPNFCNINAKKRIPDFDKFISNHILLPNIKNEFKFYVMDYVVGDPIISISRDEFFFLKNHRDFNGYTPFYNSMCYNLVRGESLKLIDLKHFEKIDEKPFFIYLNNIEADINVLYIEQDTNLNIIIKHLEKDYKIRDIIIYK